MARSLCLLRRSCGFLPNIALEDKVSYGDMIVVGSGIGRVTFVHYVVARSRYHDSHCLS